MIKFDLHTHTTFSDGKNTIEEMIQKAISLGLDTIGISDHSFTGFNTSYCMKENALDEYINTIKRLKEKYKDKINVLCGIEYDYFSEIDTSCFDYVIGAVHFLKIGNEYIEVDNDKETLIDCANKYFNGDIYKVAEIYYSELANVVEKTKCDYIAHFDLISKFNEDNKLFDENDVRYIDAWKAAADSILKTGRIFEINTGAISRGYKTKPYPSFDIFNYLKNNGAKFIFSSDSHSVKTIGFGFDYWRNIYEF